MYPNNQGNFHDNHRHRRFEQPHPRSTHPLTWLLGVVCALFWVIVILVGLATLIVYLVFRPKTPRVEISSATLNAAYVDAGVLLNADVTLLANFTNPNHRVDISYTDMAVYLYYNRTLVATQGIEPFGERRGESEIRDVHLVASQVELPVAIALRLKTKVEGGDPVAFEVRGNFKTRSIFRGFVKISYRLHSSCSILVSAPPSGVLLSSKCRTKR